MGRIYKKTWFVESNNWMIKFYGERESWVLFNLRNLLCWDEIYTKGQGNAFLV